MVGAHLAETNTTGVCANFRVRGGFCSSSFCFSTFYTVGTVAGNCTVVLSVNRAYCTVVVGVNRAYCTVVLSVNRAYI